MNLNYVTTTTILFFAVRSAAVLLLASLGGIFSERSGVVNIALEGMITMGSFAAVATTIITKQPWLGVLAAILAGMLMAALHAVLSIRFKANQVISGTAINILAAGLSSFLMKSLFNQGGHLLLENAPKLSDWSIPIIKDLPWIGPILGTHTPGVYLAFVFAGIAHYVLFHTPLGLRIRAVGEHPHAADTVGVNVYRTRYLGVILSGVLAGFAGSVLSIGIGSAFLENMAAGRGFIALAAVIFGKWTPLGTMAACLLFGLSEAVQVTSNLIGIGKYIPSNLMATFPYIITMLALAGFVGRSIAPAASGQPYEVDKR